jgi:DNA polymerase V
MSSTKPNNQLIALVDCNNFYVSCERVFNPKMINKPVVVLSNNDGCIIARSKEVKKLGIPMGVPLFQNEPLLKKHGVLSCSSNYTLYGDMSQRVMQTLKLFTSDIQIYSIDEAFLYLDANRAEGLCFQAKQTVLQHTGIPVSIGIAQTKTLAKIANHTAKKDPTKEGVFLMADASIQEAILRDLLVEDVWGIGRQISQFLYNQGIKTAWQLRNADDVWIRKNLSVVILRTAWELRGIPCLSLEQLPLDKKSIISSKSFGRAVVQLDELGEALSAYTARAAEKLRRQKSLASRVGVFIESKRDYETGVYANQIYAVLPQPTAFTPTLIEQGKFLLRKIFREGFRYKKVGIFLDGLVPEESFQLDLFTENNQAKQQALMKLMDQTNLNFGKKVIRLAAEGTSQPWKMKQAKRSPRFTTRWNELLSIYI